MPGLAIAIVLVIITMLISYGDISKHSEMVIMVFGMIFIVGCAATCIGRIFCWFIYLTTGNTMWSDNDPLWSEVILPMILSGILITSIIVFGIELCFFIDRNIINFPSFSQIMLIIFIAMFVGISLFNFIGVGVMTMSDSIEQKEIIGICASCTFIGLGILAWWLIFNNLTSISEVFYDFYNHKPAI